MTNATLEIIRSALKADTSITPEERAKLIKLLRSGGAPPVVNSAPRQPPEAPKANVLSRRVVARQLGRSLRFVDQLHRDGHLPKVIMPGRQRGIGFLQSDVDALIINGR
jgi:predicted DNA-binding transcriptional regulator AlpA